MARSISNLRPGDKVTLIFHGSRSLGNEPYTDDVELLGFAGEGATQRAQFGNPDYPGQDEWEAYKFNGRWCYGASAEKVTVAA